MNEVMILAKKKPKGSTFDPAGKATGVALSLNNTRATFTPDGSAVRGVLGKSSGKWYFEMIVTQFEGATQQYGPLCGLCTTGTPLVAPWLGPDEALWYTTGGTSVIIHHNNIRTPHTPGYGSGARIGLAADLDAKSFYFTLNGVARASNLMSTYMANPNSVFYPMAASPQGTNGNAIVDYVESPVNIPSGYLAW